jgi:hypothetical protein
MKRISINYSLWGSSEEYYLPLLKSLQLGRHNEVNAEVRVFYDNSVNEEILQSLREFGVILVKVDHKKNLSNSEKMTWRYGSIFDSCEDIVFIRDSDSLITTREVILMNKFINSKYLFHTIRDHCEHIMPIMGGLFGIKSELFNIFKKTYEKKFYKFKELSYQGDQLFLGKYVYPQIRRKLLAHTSTYAYTGENYSLICLNDSDGFIGRKFLSDAHDNSNNNHALCFISFFWIFRMSNFRGLYFFYKKKCDSNA